MRKAMALLVRLGTGWVGLYSAAAVRRANTGSHPPPLPLAEGFLLAVRTPLLPLPTDATTSPISAVDNVDLSQL